MKAFRFRILALVLVVTMLGLICACASLDTPGNPTTQLAGQVSQTAGALALVSAAVPMPYGLIISGILGLISIVAGSLVGVHQLTANNVTAAVAAGATAANTSLASNPTGASAALSAADAAAAAAAQALGANQPAAVAIPSPVASPAVAAAGTNPPFVKTS